MTLQHMHFHSNFSNKETGSERLSLKVMQVITGVKRT